ncbi:glucoamylase family protein [Cytophagales bacterium LB-30]|uniref:Glucoamylase family protein n=1 Tax=Shiella aurantiaca TaxID=3058365 RepID=A0ABT8F867_9BACT|nr:glucoamylase family protein [Shiella aurantiaca]MDN4166635.1 glucoamylase family protein [Shiella aurantiaca]
MRSSFFYLFLFLLLACKQKPEEPRAGQLQLRSVSLGTFPLSLSADVTTEGAPKDQAIVIRFNSPLDTGSVPTAISLMKGETPTSVRVEYLDNNQTVSLLPQENLPGNTTFTLFISDALRGINQETFPGLQLSFQTEADVLRLLSLTIDEQEALQANRVQNISLQPQLSLYFSAPVAPESVNAQSLRLVSAQGQSIPLNMALSEDARTVSLSTDQALLDWNKYTLFALTGIEGQNEEIFEGLNLPFYTQGSDTPKFPLIDDESLLTLVQERTFAYFWDFAHPHSGLARERNTSGNTVTIGGSGFGLMALIVGIERNFITRAEGIARWEKIVTFLGTADRHHGVWPHWMDGNTGATIPFSTNDNGGDLVETAFMAQGLITVRQYLNPNEATESALIDAINNLLNTIEWDWYTREGQNVLYWHWSPTVGWAMNMPIRGHNETLITYVLAASSTTHGIAPSVYHEGYARNGGIQNGNSFYDITLPLGEDRGGPLFFTHYSFLGLDPRNLSDDYANYWEQNRNHTLINRAYCIDNPQDFVGYSEQSWGLTASDNPEGYSAHAPNNDQGVITPTAALSSFPYTPEESMQALHFFYYGIGDRLWGEYGFYDAYDLTEGWVADSYLAIDQGPIIIMIENHRTGLLWDLFMSAPEVQNGLSTLNFSY